MFIRSQASQAESGGLAPDHLPGRPGAARGCSTWCWSRRSAWASRRTTSATSRTRPTSCCSPSRATRVQHLKAGLMEAPDVIVVTKCDVGDLAHRALADLRGRDRPGAPGRAIPLYAVSARTGAGIAEVAAAVAATAGRPRASGDDWFLTRAVRPPTAGSARPASPSRAPGLRFAGRAPGRGARPLHVLVRLTPPHPAVVPPRRCAAPAYAIVRAAMSFSRPCPYTLSNIWTTFPITPWGELRASTRRVFRALSRAFHIGV